MRNLKKFVNIQFKIAECEDDLFQEESEDSESDEEKKCEESESDSNKSIKNENNQ